MYRIIFFGKSKRRTKTTAHLVRAFREKGNGILWLNPTKIRRVKKNNTNQFILKKINEVKPDFVFITSKDIPLPVLKEIKAKNIISFIYYEDMSPQLSADMVERGKLSNFFLATNSGMLAEYRQQGVANPIYFVGACDRHDHRWRRPLLPIWKSDVAFIGNARPDEPRVILMQKLSQNYRVKVYGKNWEKFGLKATLKSVTPRLYGLICRGAKIVLGADITNEVQGYWSNRLWLTLGCGGFFLTSYVLGMEKYFINKTHLVWYNNQEDFFNLVEEYLSKPEERLRIARQGYEFVHKNYTFHHFVERVLDLYAETRT